MNERVTIIQFQPELANPEENTRRLEPLIDSAGNSHLVVLPELSNSGYNFMNREQAFHCAENIGNSGIFQDFLVRKAKKNNNFIVSGINEKEGDKLYNSAILVGPGGILGKYRKLHLFMNEKDLFQKGDAGLPVFDLGAFKIGIMICFDYLFPEPWRIMAQKGADLICHPSNLLTENPQRCLPGIAFMNRIYITEPSGKIISMFSVDQPEIATIEIDTQLSRNKMITKRNHAFDDRRPEVYLP
jgi:predicted amidohydrolase